MTRRSPPAETTLEHEVAQRLRELLATHMHARRFSRGEFLWREGDHDGLLVHLRSGRVKTCRTLPTGGSVTLLLFQPGDVFGMLPLLDGGPYPGSAIAMEPVEAEVMARSVFHQVLAADPGLATELVTVLGHRLRQAFDVIRSLSTPGARSRVAAALLDLMPAEARSDGPVEVRLPVSAHEFAAALGLAPETWSRAVSSLVRRKILRRKGTGVLEILDATALEGATHHPER